MVEFTSSSCFVKDQATKTTILHGILCNGLYKLVLPCSTHQVMQVTSSLDLWHSRLAHSSTSAIKALSTQKKITMSKQNGLVERKHRHVVELGLVSMYHASIPLAYWDTMFESTLFVINRLPTAPQFISSPYEILFTQPPDYQFFHTIGCECFPLLRPYNQHKLQPRSESCVFMGYSALHKGYKCLHIPTQRLYISRHVQFNEFIFSFSQITPSDPEPSQMTISTPLTVFPSDSSSPSLNNLPTSHPSSQLTPSPSPQHPSITSHPMTIRAKTNSLRPK
jgi:hypothetical protein